MSHFFSASYGCLGWLIIYCLILQARLIIITFIPITRHNKHQKINLISYFTHIIKYLLLMYLLYLLYFNLIWNKGDPQTELLPRIPLLEKKVEHIQLSGIFSLSFRWSFFWFCNFNLLISFIASEASLYARIAQLKFHSGPEIFCCHVQGPKFTCFSFVKRCF